MKKGTKNGLLYCKMGSGTSKIRWNWSLFLVFPRDFSAEGRSLLVLSEIHYWTAAKEIDRKNWSTIAETGHKLKARGQAQLIFWFLLPVLAQHAEGQIAEVVLVGG